MTALRTDIKRLVSSDIDLNPLMTHYELALPASDIDDIKDVLIVLAARSTVQPVGASRLLGGVQDLRILLNDKDITAPLVKSLQRALRQKPAAELAGEYRRGALGWLDEIKKAGLAWPEFDRDRARVSTLGAADIIGAMAKLGDRSFGWSGQIHPFNYLYRQITLPPLSLKDVLTGVAGDPNALAIEIQRSKTLQVTVLEREINRAGGRVQLSLEGVYINPLAELLEQALAALEAARKTLEDQRVNYLLPMRDDLNQVKADLPKGFQSVSTSITTIDASIKDLVNHT